MKTNVKEKLLSLFKQVVCFLTGGKQLKTRGAAKAVIILALATWSTQGIGDDGKKRQVSLPDCKNTALEGCVDGRLLHVPSPDWRDQIIYALMVDRFNDGDPARNDQGAGVYDPQRASHYNGGDIRGIIDKIGYIKSLGATAVWTTPVLAHQWYDPVFGYTGYHGYWPVNFLAVDKHFGSLDDYKDLSDTLHRNGMYLIKDAIVNHTAHFYHHNGPYNPSDKTQNFELHRGYLPAEPPMPPFDQFNLLNPDHLAADIYHWTPEIMDFADPDPEVRLTHQLGQLNDLNTGNPVVRKVLKDAYRYWIREVGIDGVRLDTVKYVEHDFWHDFIHSKDGIGTAAKTTGRENLLTFGESFDVSVPGSNEAEKRIVAYTGTPDKPELSTLLGFPLFSEITQVINFGKPTDNLTYRLQAQMDLFPDPYIVPNFLSNHDVQRFLSTGNRDGLKQAYAVIMTIPGIPVIYQGDEQALIEPRQAMFKGGFLSPQDRFDQASEMFRHIQSLTGLRKKYRALTRGSIEVVADSPGGPGVFAYKREYKGERLLILLNTSDYQTTLANQVPTGLTGGQRLKPLFAVNADLTGDFKADKAGNLTVTLARKATLILTTAELPESPVADQDPHKITVEKSYAGQTLSQDVLLQGTVSQPGTTLKLVVDGNLDSAVSARADAEGRWSTTLPIRGYGEKTHEYAIYAPELGVASKTYRYKSRVEEPTLDLSITDPAYDDHGRRGLYQPPARDSVSGEMDIVGVHIKSGGPVLEVGIETRDVSNVWIPINGFDHVAFHLFFDLPDQFPGLNVLPELRARGPDGFAWDLTHKVHGFGSTVYTTEGASANQTGVKGSIDVQIKLDQENKTLYLTYDGSSLGINDWQGTDIYITTWDTDGRGIFRALKTEADVWDFGGAGGADKGLILDDVLVNIPAQSRR